MLQIQNVGNSLISFSTSYLGAQGRPLYIKLQPEAWTTILQNELKNWPPGAKQNLASYVQKGQLTVRPLTICHVVNDEGNIPPEFGAFDLPSALRTASDLKTIFNDHLLSVAVHSAQDTANLMTTADPIDLPTLIAFIGNFQIDFNAHILVGAAHPNPDIVNGVVVVAADLPTSILALKELYGRFDAHKRHTLSIGTPLNPPAIITY